MTEGTPPRPDLVLFEDSLPLLTKKDSQARRRLNQRPPPLPSNRRKRRSTEPRHAQAISFCGSESSFHSRHYQEQAAGSYLHQCFHVDRKLGEGSFGVVYRVRCLDDGRWYAVKVANRQFRGQRDRRLQLQEVAKHELLPPHPHCVRFIKAWEEDSRLYIQTELCECTLAAYAEKHHNLPEQLVWEFLVDLLLVVKHMHGHDLAHLDIKPENIFISKDGYYKLGDFGLVLDLNQDNSSEPRDGDPRYLAPELMDGNFTKAADIFSLGITVLELACDLELPSGGESWHALRSGILPHYFTQSLSPQLRVVIEQMLHPDPEQRITADQLLAQPAIYRVSRWRRLYVARRRAVGWVKDLLLLTWFWVQPFLEGAWSWVFSCIKMPLPTSPPSVTRRTPVQNAIFSDVILADETYEDLNLGHGMHQEIPEGHLSGFERGLSDVDYSPRRSTPQPLQHRPNSRLHSTPMAVLSSRCTRLHVARSSMPFNMSGHDGTVKNLFPVIEGKSSSGEDSL